MKKPDLTEYARQNRMSMTPAERLLWAHLSERRLGFRFRRQQPVGPYILDFYCAERRVAIELDGESHLGMEEYDAARDAQLARENIVVLRFPNDAPVDRVVAEIRQACEGRPIFRY